ncbi:MAG: LacI family DNA-binding transcriptional regulator [Spirochaetaceae bacterium]|nr:LacI family DNA-binding transcriptional regulator [Spirochaetaceae bacterium]RKX89319.1 MAG: LacI family transcriptional regulator [Spirochaetota bacterium]
MGQYNITEIAEICNTSPATVSRVLNNPTIVAEPLRKRIQNKMVELDYRPNPFASRLSSQSHWGLALFVFDILNPFFALIVRKISHLAMERRIPLTVCDTENNEEKERLYLDYLLDNKIGGIIFAEGISENTIERAREATETVLLDQHFQEGLISEVTSDNYLGGCQATEYLIQMNHRNIGFVAGPRDWASAEDRFRGYRDTLGKHGITYRADLVYRGDLRFESGIGALEYYLSLTDWPSAIFCANDQMAFGVLTKANSMNISIPGDISLIGFDDIPLYSLYTTRLTAVQQNVDALCSSSFGIMMEKLRQDQDQDQNQLSIKRVVIPTKLKIGETCGKYNGMSHN